MVFKWIGPLALLAALVIGDQIRINRPGHKYRLTVEVETPDGVKSASSILAVTPDRGYSRGGATRTSGEAVVVDLGSGRTLVALLAHLVDGKIDLDAINYVALRAYTAARGKRANFHDMNREAGVVPVTPPLIPVLLAFADSANPATANLVLPDDAMTTLGSGFRLRGVTAEVVPNGLWPVDFGGALGEPVTRGNARKLPWLGSADLSGAATALRAAGLPAVETIHPGLAFRRD